MTDQHAASSSPVSAGTDGPIVIVSATRSGSTLLQRALNTCEGVTIWGEHFGLLTPLTRSVRIARTNARALERGNSFADRVRDADRAGTVANPHVNPFDAPGYETRVRAFLETLFGSDGNDTRWGFKEVRYGHAELEVLLDLYPTLRVVVLAREPGEQIDSMARAPWRRVPDLDDPSERAAFAGQLEKFAVAWTNRYSSLRKFARTYPGSTFTLRYDQLSAGSLPADELGAFLGLDLVDNSRLTTVFETKLGSSDTTTGWTAVRRGQLREMIDDISYPDGHAEVRDYFLAP